MTLIEFVRKNENDKIISLSLEKITWHASEINVTDCINSHMIFDKNHFLSGILPY